MAQAIPDGAGNISATFTVPAGEPGFYVVMASHKDAEGKDTFAPRLGLRSRSSAPTARLPCSTLDPDIEARPDYVGPLVWDGQRAPVPGGHPSPTSSRRA